MFKYRFFYESSVYRVELKNGIFEGNNNIVVR